MSTVARADTFPRVPLLVAGTLLVVSLALAGIGRLGSNPTRTPEQPVAARDLLFSDRGDGAVVVTTPGAAQPLAVETGENGFLRGTVRGLARARHQLGLGPDTPFRLAAWPDGRLTLDDPATGRRVELAAFGPTNEAVFARLLGTLPRTAAGGAQP